MNVDELELTVRRVLETAELRESIGFYRNQLASLRPGPLVFDSAAMREVQAMIDAVGPTDTTVLILGESGTGKEMVAQALHDRSPRASRELVAIDGSGLQENLFESELFGHERGAFTGADRQKKGLIEEAAGSTLFLDEIGDAGPAIQAKLLRVMETSTFRRLGGNKTLTADARFIAATNRDLAAMSRNGSFRSDLYFRMSRFVITVPALRERREDIEPLARHFIALLTRTAPMTLAPDALKLLTAYAWPGNVRELRNAIERAVILARPGGQVRTEHLAFIPRDQSGEVVLRFGQEPTLEQIEQEYLRQVMARHAWGYADLERRIPFTPETMFLICSTHRLPSPGPGASTGRSNPAADWPGHLRHRPPTCPACRRCRRSHPPRAPTGAGRRTAACSRRCPPTTRPAGPARPG